MCFWRMPCSTATYLGIMDRSCDKLPGIFKKKWPGGLCKEGHCQKPPMHDDSLKACIKGFRHSFCFRPSTLTYFTLPDSSCPELSRIVKSMAQINTKPKNFLANQCLLHTFYRPWKVGHSSCQNAIMKAADVAHTRQAIHMTALYRWVAMAFIFSVCPHHVHACMQKRCMQRDRCKACR